MPRPKLTFYLDLQSPYAYLAYKYIRSSIVFKHCEVSYVPVLLIGFVKAKVSTPPWGSKNRVDYIWKDIARWSQQFGIPWRPGDPANYPTSRTSEVQRVVTACSVECPNMLEDLLDALFHAFWVEKRAVQLPEVFESIVRTVLEKSLASEVIKLSRSDEVQTMLRKNTQEAIEDGACGLPWFTAINARGEKDVFWGFDHLGQVARFMGLDVPTSHL